METRVLYFDDFLKKLSDSFAGGPAFVLKVGGVCFSTTYYPNEKDFNSFSAEKLKFDTDFLHNASVAGGTLLVSSPALHPEGKDYQRVVDLEVRCYDKSFVGTDTPIYAYVVLGGTWGLDDKFSEATDATALCVVPIGQLDKTTEVFIIRLMMGTADVLF